MRTALAAACRRRWLHSDARQLPWAAGNVRIASNADRPITPVKGSGVYQTLRRRIGRSRDPDEVVAVITDAARGGGVDTATVSAAVQRAGELRSFPAVVALLRVPVDAGDPTYVGVVLTALERCARRVWGDAGEVSTPPAPPAEILRLARKAWAGLAAPAAPCYGAALALCARLQELAWAEELWSGVAPVANVIHLGCYLRVLAAAGRWGCVETLWGDPDGPAPNAACLAGIIPHAASAAALEELWGRYAEEVEVTPTLVACAMRQYLKLGNPHAVLALAARAPPSESPPCLRDRFGGKRYVIDLWVYELRAHQRLHALSGDASHAAAARAVAEKALRPHIVRNVPPAYAAEFARAAEV